MSNVDILANGHITVEDAKLLSGNFRNFAGEPDRFSPSPYNKGWFSVEFDKEQAEQLKELGWNIKSYEFQSQGDSDEPNVVYYLKVSYPITRDPKIPDRFPRDVYMVSKTAKAPLDSSSVANLNYNRFQRIDIEIRPYDYDVNGRQGRSAYLQSGFFEIQEIPFADRYADIPMAE